jgi:UDP-N-acetylmuramoyl-L-alanyl-D-glutamate--2,6-diaminopimelate ligase
MWQQVKNYYHLAQAIIASIYYGFPGRKLHVIGVTGTDGKTTTTNIIYHIFKTAEKKVSMISTISAVIGGASYDTGFHTTTPSAFAVQKYLRKAVDEGSDYMILEVTSHALDQYRAWGIPFAAAALTNVTHEHLDYHKTYDNYLRSKMRLLEQADICLINKDDQSFEKIHISKRKVVTYGLGKDADLNPEVFPFKTSLHGVFNQYNCLAAIGVARSFNIDDTIIRDALRTVSQLTGRDEVVYDKDFTVIIDFAHTPNALEQILKTVTKEYGKHGRIIHVFGSAGQRDASKRPLMGKYSWEYANITIVTAEDPRDEPVEKITDDIICGMDDPTTEAENKHKYVLRIPDRQEAITKAIKVAKKGDVVLITGKGHEQSMNFGHGETPWSDHEAVAEALRNR